MTSYASLTDLSMTYCSKSINTFTCTSVFSKLIALLICYFKPFIKGEAFKKLVSALSAINHDYPLQLMISHPTGFYVTCEREQVRIQTPHIVYNSIKYKYWKGTDQKSGSFC